MLLHQSSVSKPGAEKLPEVIHVKRRSITAKCRGIKAPETKADPEHQLSPGPPWSGRRESNPRIQLGRLVFYH